MQNIKCVIVGDSRVGKTSLLMSYTTNSSYLSGLVSTVLDNHSVYVNDRNFGEVNLELWDTACHEDYDRLRPLAYPQTDVFLLAFNILGYSSFINIKEKWWPEIQHHAPGVPIILVGTNGDLREGNGDLLITNEEGLGMADEIAALKYLECSAVTLEGVKNVFDKAIISALIHRGLTNKSQGKEGCVLS